MRSPRTKYKALKTKYPGEYVQIDVKYVPMECIKFEGECSKYYQITAIDLYSRKRVLKTEKSIAHMKQRSL